MACPAWPGQWRALTRSSCSRAVARPSTQRAGSCETPAAANSSSARPPEASGSSAWVACSTPSSAPVRPLSCSAFQRGPSAPGCRSAMARRSVPALSGAASSGASCTSSGASSRCRSNASGRASRPARRNSSKQAPAGAPKPSASSSSGSASQPRSASASQEPTGAEWPWRNRATRSDSGACSANQRLAPSSSRSSSSRSMVRLPHMSRMDLAMMVFWISFAPA